MKKFFKKFITIAFQKFFIGVLEEEAAARILEAAEVAVHILMEEAEEECISEEAAAHILEADHISEAGRVSAAAHILEADHISEAGHISEADHISEAEERKIFYHLRNLN